MMAWSAATAIRMPKRHGHTGTHPLREAADVLGRLEIPAGSLKVDGGGKISRDSKGLKKKWLLR
jgi:hypothetical protein